MFLRNFDNWMLCLFGALATANTNDGHFGSHLVGYGNSGQVGNTTSSGEGYINVITTNNTISKVNLLAHATSGYGKLYMPVLMAPGCICLGTGDTAVTYNDHKLSGDSVDNKLLKYVANSQTVEWDNTKRAYIKSVQYTYTNNTGADITIKEWGLFVPNAAVGTTSAVTFDNNSAAQFIVFREVLDTPITIAAGTTGTLTFSVDLPMIHHP